MVVMVIGILAAMAVLGLNKQQERARDTRRKTDLVTINEAVQTYIAANYEPPIVTAYTAYDPGGWDYSSLRGGVFITGGDGEFMKFLKDGNYIPQVPVDPINDGQNDVHYGGTGYAYAYYYYRDSSQGALHDVNGYTTYQLNAKLEQNGNIVGPKTDYRLTVRPRQ